MVFTAKKPKVYPKKSSIKNFAPLQKKQKFTTIIARIIRGSKFMKRSRGFNLQTRPETKLPTGIVAIPQRRPKKSSLCCVCLTSPIENGMVKDITHPIIEEITKAL